MANAIDLERQRQALIREAFMVTDNVPRVGIVTNTYKLFYRPQDAIPAGPSVGGPRKIRLQEDCDGELS